MSRLTELCHADPVEAMPFATGAMTYHNSIERTRGGRRYELYDGATFACDPDKDCLLVVKVVVEMGGNAEASLICNLQVLAVPDLPVLDHIGAVIQTQADTVSWSSSADGGLTTTICIPLVLKAGWHALATHTDTGDGSITCTAKGYHFTLG